MDTPPKKVFPTIGSIFDNFMIFGLIFGGMGLAISEILDQPSQAGVSFILMGIAWLLLRLVDCVEGILRGVTSLQRLTIEQKEK